MRHAARTSELSSAHARIAQLARELAAAGQERSDLARLVESKEQLAASVARQAEAIRLERDQLQSQVVTMQAGVVDVDTKDQLDLLKVQHAQVRFVQGGMRPCMRAI